VSVERHRRAKEIFLEAASLSCEERPGFLDRASGGDAALLDEVRSLLREDGASQSYLDSRGAVLAALADPGGSGPTAAQGPSAPPERLAGYTIVKKLGEGGMGAVFEALQENPRRKVALKVISSRLGSEALVKRFEQEGQVLGLLDHPGIARIYEAGTAETAEGRVPYFAMELIEGKPLTGFIRDRRLGLREKLDLVARICDAVEHAHQRGVIHRDLKPANILVDGEGNPKILDFGIARATDPDHQLGTLHTRTGQILGTLSYMSPEQAGGEREKIERRSDIYSLGVILYEILAGRLPHDLDSMELYAALRVLKEEEPRRLSGFDRAFRGDLDVIVSKAIEKVPERRYHTVADLASDIRRHLRNEPILAYPPSAAYRLKKFAVRHKLLVGALVVLLITASVTTWLALAAMRSETIAEGRYEDARSVNDFIQKMFESLDGRRAGPGAKIVDLLDRAALDLESGRRIEPTARAALLSSIGMGYHGIGRYEQAEPLLLEALDLYRRTLGESAPEVAESCYKLGCVVQRRGDYPRAQGLLERAYDMQRVRSADGGLDAALTLDRLGAVVWVQGDTPRGEETLKRALEIHRRLLGGDHPRIVMSLHRLATLLSSKGEGERAEGLFIDALAMARRIGPEDSLDVALVQEKLASHYITVSAFGKAEPLLREIAQTVERHLGPDHPDVASALYNQARFLKDVFRPMEAAAPARRSLQIRLKAYPRVHKEVAESMSLVGAVSLGLGDVAQADQYLKEAMEIQAEMSGAQSLPVVDLLNSMADVIEWKGRLDESLTLRERALEVLRSLGMEDSISGARSFLGMGGLRAKRGEASEAESSTRKSLEIFRRKSGPESFDAAFTEYLLASVLADSKRGLDEAEGLLRHSHRVSRSMLGPKTYYPGVLAGRLGSLLSGLERFAEAEPFLREAIEGHEAGRPGDQSSVRRSELALGDCLVRLGKFAEAEAILRKSHDAPGGSRRQSCEALIRLYDAWGRREVSEGLRGQLSLLGDPASPTAGAAELPPGIDRIDGGPGDAIVDLPHTLRSEPFRSDKEGVQHASSYWEVRRWDADYALEPTFIKMSAKDLTELALPRGLLLPGAAYRWRVLYAGSDRSAPVVLAEKSFRTGGFPFEVVRVDLAALFNRDVVADADDPQNDFFDGDEKSRLLVDGFDGATTSNSRVRGLPIDRKVVVHELGDYTKPNALQLAPEDLQPVRIDVPPRRYAALRFLLSGGSGDSAIPAEFHYRGGAVSRHYVPCDDWFHDNPSDSQGGLQQGLTPVLNGMDRMYLGRFEDRNDPALFELVVETRPDAVLEAVVLLPEEGLFSTRYTRFNLLAVTGIREGE